MISQYIWQGIWILRNSILMGIIIYILIYGVLLISKRRKVVDIKASQDIVSQEVVEYESQNEMKNSNKISADACVMLAYASEDPNGQIMQLAFLGGTSISTKGIEFVRKDVPRELARWTSAIDELLRQGYIKLVGRKDKIYAITNSGYVFADKIKGEFNIDTNKDFEEYLVD